MGLLSLSGYRYRIPSINLHCKTRLCRVWKAVFIAFAIGPSLRRLELLRTSYPRVQYLNLNLNSAPRRGAGAFDEFTLLPAPDSKGGAHSRSGPSPISASPKSKSKSRSSRRVRRGAKSKLLPNASLEQQSACPPALPIVPADTLLIRCPVTDCLHLSRNKKEACTHHVTEHVNTPSGSTELHPEFCENFGLSSCNLCFFASPRKIDVRHALDRRGVNKSRGDCP